MARRKEVITQRDFSLGAVRPEAVERDDVALVERSVKEGRNTLSLVSGQIENRPGTLYLNETTAKEGFEVDLGSGLVFDLHITSTGLVVYDETGAAVYTNSGTTWVSVTGVYGSPAFADLEFWTIADPDSSSVIIGSSNTPPYALVRDSAGSWSLGVMSYSTGLDGSINQPYWPYERGSTLTVSARSGSVNVTCSSAIFTAAWVGMTVRYHDREILLTGLTSSTIMTGTVVQKLPPSKEITVTDTSEYTPGEAVEHSVGGGKGIVQSIKNATVLNVICTELWDGFPASGSLIGPNASQSISAVTTLSGVLASYVWDIQMGSAVYGYPGTAARHQNRAYLGRYPRAPLAFASSVGGAVTDFFMGTNDADGFVDAVGSDRGGELLYIISAEDLLFITSNGLYYQFTRDSTPVTPQSIRPTFFSSTGAAQVRPVALDDGVVFIDAVGEQVWTAILSGDVYKAWKARSLTQLHPHLVVGPIHIGATASGSERPEMFVYVTNSDGSVAVGQWNRESNSVSWRPWDTDGTFRALYQAFGRTHCVVDRTINSASKTFRERFEYGLYLDCVAAVKISASFPEGEAGVTFDQGVTAFATHLTGAIAATYFEGWDMGDNLTNGSGKPVDDDGNVIDYPDYEGIAQVGLVFDLRVVPWSRRSIRTQSGERDVKRLVQLYVSVQDSTSFEINGKTFGAYYFGEDLSVPPPLRSEEYRHTLIGADAYEAIPITKSRPGPWRLLKLRFKVVV